MKEMQLEFEEHHQIHHHLRSLLHQRQLGRQGWLELSAALIDRLGMESIWRMRKGKRRLCGRRGKCEGRRLFKQCRRVLIWRERVRERMTLGVSRDRTTRARPREGMRRLHARRGWRGAREQGQCGRSGREQSGE